jgi:DNA polymerase III delta prime subunit
MEGIKMTETKIWTFVHEPSTLDEMILPPDIRPKLEKALVEIPNLLLVGPAGVGKGTFTNIFLKQTGLDYIRLNASDERNIDDMRTKVKSFATGLGITPLKVVILNEADGLNPMAQKNILDLIERVQKITRFILICNYGHMILPELQSRCQTISFGNLPMKDIGVHCMKILKAEGVKIKDTKIVSEIIKRYYPDVRKIVNTLQLNTIDGKIDAIVVLDNVNEVYMDILKMMKKSDIEGVRKSLRSNSVNYPDLYQFLFDEAGTFKSPGDMIIQVADALFRNGLVAIQEINFMGFVVSCMKKGFI